MSLELRSWRGVLLALLVAAAAVIVAIAGTDRTAFAASDLALGKTASADTAQAGHEAAHGNDSSSTTRWCASNSATGHWWQVDLGTEADLSGTEVVWEFARNYRYRIQTSLDGSTWTTATDQSADTRTSQTRADSFTARARHVRITVTGLEAGTWASFFAFRVLGTQDNPPPADGPAVNPVLRAQCTGTSPIRCHYGYPVGHYDVTVELGGATAGVTTVLAEARRVMLPQVATAAGQTVRYTFTVNVRQPEGQPTGQGGTGTPGLDLEFGGSAPRLSGLGIVKVTPKPVLYLAGDSTVCDQPTAPYAGWGQWLPAHFKRGPSVANYADSGESSGSFLALSALFPTMEPLITQGDHVLVQFGHNDKTVTASAFTSNLTTLVQRIRARGGVPILLTPPVRRGFDSTGRLTQTALHLNGVGTDLPAEMKRVATAESVPLIDLTAKSKALVESLGPAGSQRIYLAAATDGVNDNTHFSSYGGGVMAQLVVDGLRELRITALTSALR